MWSMRPGDDDLPAIMRGLPPEPLEEQNNFRGIPLQEQVTSTAWRAAQ